jgi:hypothetical protein
MNATIEGLWEAVFSVDPCGTYIWRIETQAKKKKALFVILKELGTKTN